MGGISVEMSLFRLIFVKTLERLCDFVQWGLYARIAQKLADSLQLTLFLFLQNK